MIFGIFGVYGAINSVVATRLAAINKAQHKKQAHLDSAQIYKRHHRRLIINFFGILASLFGAAGLFALVEDWTFVRGLYFAVQTATVRFPHFPSFFNLFFFCARTSVAPSPKFPVSTLTLYFNMWRWYITFRYHVLTFSLSFIFRRLALEISQLIKTSPPSWSARILSCPQSCSPLHSTTSKRWTKTSSAWRKQRNSRNERRVSPK